MLETHKLDEILNSNKMQGDKKGLGYVEGSSIPSNSTLNVIKLAVVDQKIKNTISNPKGKI